MRQRDEECAPDEREQVQCGSSAGLRAGSSSDLGIARSLDAFVRGGQVPGVTAVVTSRDELLYAGSFGTADVEEPRPLASDAIFRVASLTKIITSIAIVQLLERGAISLGDAVEAYLPQFRDICVLESRPAALRAR